MEAVICFDANLPTLERCRENCQNREGVLCVHRFNSKVKVEYYNTRKLQALTDLNVFLHFIASIINIIAEGKINPDECAFIILTKDRNFIDDIKEDLVKWARIKWPCFNLRFAKHSIAWDGIDVFIQQVDCPNYGNSRTDDLKCAFLKVNTFLNKYRSF